MADEMLDTVYLFQPRGPGTAFLFRMATPPALVGRPNPRNGGKPYRREIRESLGGVRSLPEARRLRDVRLGEIRAEERRALEGAEGSTAQALDYAADYRAIKDEDQREGYEGELIARAEQLEKRVGERRAVRWYKVATAQLTPFSDACERFKADRGKALSRSSLNNLETVIREFREFAGEDVTLEEVDRRKVAEFVSVFLPNRKGPKTPDGQGPATIRKKVSQLAQVWRWAQQRGFLPFSKETPWDEQAPSAKEVKAAAKRRRPYRPEELQKLLKAAPLGDDLGDALRVTLLTGVRLEEIAALRQDQVGEDARWYVVAKGKTDAATRIVPLVDVARSVIWDRASKAESGAKLFPRLAERKSTGKAGGALSQAFTRLRRDTLGEETDGELDFHAFRHTWRTAARRAGVDERTSHEIGGWSRGKQSDLPYDHGLEVEQYEREQQKVADWLRDKGYLD